MGKEAAVEAIEPNKALTVQERAVAALGLANLKDDLKELAAKSTDIVKITNPDGYQQVHSARMVLKNQRIDIQKKGKAARDDANAFAKAVIAEEKRLIGIIEPEEQRLQALQKEHDDAAEAERQRQIEAEEERIDNITTRIREIRNDVETATLDSVTSDALEAAIKKLESTVIDDSFDEYRQHAQDAKDAGLLRLKNYLQIARDREEEARQAEANRRELEALRKEKEEREAREAEARRKAQEEEDRKRRLKEEQDRKAQAAADKKRRDELEAQRKKQAAEQARIDKEKADLQAEQDRIAREQQEAEDQRMAEERAEADRRAAAEAEARKSEYPGDAAILAALVEKFGVSIQIAESWFAFIRSRGE